MVIQSGRSTYCWLFDGDGDCAGEGFAEERELGGAADADLEGSFEGKLFGEGEGDAGADAFSGEVAEHLGIGVGDAGHLGGLAGAELREGLRLMSGKGAVECG